MESRVGDYTILNATHGYALLSRAGDVVGVFPTVRSAWLTGLDLTAKACQREPAVEWMVVRRPRLCACIT